MWYIVIDFINNTIFLSQKPDYDKEYYETEGPFFSEETAYQKMITKSQEYDKIIVREY